MPKLHRIRTKKHYEAYLDLIESRFDNMYKLGKKDAATNYFGNWFMKFDEFQKCYDYRTKAFFYNYDKNIKGEIVQCFQKTLCTPHIPNIFWDKSISCWHLKSKIFGFTIIGKNIEKLKDAVEEGLYWPT
jgi:hypothetical protein